MARRPLRHRHGLFQAGRALRAIANGSLGIALAWYCLVDLGGISAYGTVTGISLVLTLGSYALTGLLARADPRRVVLVALGSQTLAFLALGLQAASGEPSLLLTTLLFSWAAFSSATADPLDITLVALASNDRDRGRVVGASIFLPALAGVVALAGGGVMIELLGAGATMIAAGLFNAAGVAAIGIALGWHGANPHHEGAEAVAGLGAELRAAVRYIRAEDWLAWRFVAYGLFWPLAGASLILVPALAIELGMSSAEYGLASALVGAGAGLVPLLLTRRLAVLRPSLGITVGLPGARVLALGLVGLAGSVAPFVAALAASSLLMNLNGAAWTAVFGAVPPARRTMVTALDWLSATAASPPLRLAVPFVAGALGTGGALTALSSLGALGFFGCLALGSRRRLPRYSEIRAGRGVRHRPR